MINIDAKGWVLDARVKLEPRSAIDKGPIGKINAIVLHRTASRNAGSVLAAWKSKPEGAHFLISETGAIYQCVSVKSQCWHVGKLYAHGQIAHKDPKKSEGAATLKAFQVTR